MAARKIRVGIIGYGVVGQGIVRLLHDNAETIAGRLGASIEVRRIVARDPAKVREVPPPEGVEVGFDPELVLGDPEIDIVVEVVGGIDPAGSFVRTAIERGKHVVTANKALLAEHAELIELAEQKRVDLYFEAAVGGGIPIIRLLRESFSSDRIVALRGIVNGTSNYILTRMTDAGLDFGAALFEAQAQGYAEADPTLDIGGGDAAHKLTILATLAFGARITPDQVPTEGIDIVGAIDIHFARRFGYVIKPLALASAPRPGAIRLGVHPALVRERSVLASISGALNAVYVEGAMLGPCLISGLGAGALPTAMSVVSDIVDVGRNLLVGAHGRVPSRAFVGEHLAALEVEPAATRWGRFYLRFLVRDRPGILARIAGVLGAFDVSIEQMMQEGGVGDGGGPVSVVMLTHGCNEGKLMQALAETRSLHDLVEPPRALRIEED
jgi:homoserine dehydrogenase